jgi:class 3 adenylate cyclase
MTQDLCDAGAQQVIGAHNRIVREPSSTFQGNEIKHTGDGIMASFNNASQSVEAASERQVNTVAYTEANPDLPLHIKIGINAGEPIAEDNDLFGTTVQLTARIVDKAQKEQIFISDTVHGICQGKGVQFVKRGQFEMKGFDGGLNL